MLWRIEHKALEASAAAAAALNIYRNVALEPGLNANSGGRRRGCSDGKPHGHYKVGGAAAAAVWTRPGIRVCVHGIDISNEALCPAAGRHGQCSRHSRVRRVSCVCV